MALIYIVEDDEPIRRELADILARAGFEVEACESFEHVSRDILAAAPDLVLLDLTLPVKDGQHICHEVRHESEVPIIVLTSRTTEIDEVMAMTLGADDFVPKPYSARVLVARINALLRRTATAGERSTVVHKGLELDLARSAVTNTQTGDSTELTKNELRILSLLLSRAGKIVSRSAIMQDLWDSDAFVDDNTLTVNINRLRTTLEKIGIKGYLTTHRGQGYSVSGSAMSFTKFFKDALLSVAVWTCGVLLSCFVLAVAGAPASIVVVAVGVSFIFGILGIVIEYVRRRRFLHQLERAAEELESPAWVQEMVQCPTYAEGELEYEVLRRVGKAACDEVAEGRRQTDDYRDYIESWVHEAKLPLAAAHLILENLDGSEDDLSRVDDLGRELARVERYIDQALYYARSEVVERDYLIRRWNLKTLVTGAIKANARELIAAHVAPVCENLDFEVFTDEKWLEFILGQLIQNSIKYAREDGAKIVFSGALLDEGLASERIELTVADNGCGVCAADLPRVFEKGFTGDNGRTTKRATGIGLYLVARLCSKMGIDVTAASESGEGFVVTFSFSTNKFQYFE